MLSRHRDLDTAKQFFAQSAEVVEHVSGRVTTDGHDASPCTMHETLGLDVGHRCSPYKSNVIE